MKLITMTIVLSYLILFIIVPNFTCAHNMSQDILEGHNHARANVQVHLRPLKWNTTLAAYAQANAAKRAKNCNLEYLKGFEDRVMIYGENIAKSSRNLTAKEAVDMWVKQKKYYDYDSNSCVGHPCEQYTQVVWAHSSTVGCGKARCQNGTTFILCNYYPRGNMLGDVPYYTTIPNYT